MMPLVLPHGVDSPGAAEAAQQLPLVVAAQLPLVVAAQLPGAAEAAQLPLVAAAPAERSGSCGCPMMSAPREVA